MPAQSPLSPRRPLGRRQLLQTSALGLGGLAAAALIGCGDDEDEDSGPEPAGQAATGTAAAAPAEGVKIGDWLIPYNFPDPPGQTPKNGGNLVVGATWEASILDPAKSASGGTITVPNTVMNRLLGYKRGPAADIKKLELVPELARSWETAPDGLTYTFKLQSGVKWQNVPPLNGRAFKAADVKFVYERLQREGVHKSYFTNVQSFDAVDDGTFVIKLKAPQPDFIVALGGRYLPIHPRELVESGEIDKRSIGTGPVIMTDASSSGVKFVKNPDYWAGPPLIDSMEYRTIVEPAAMLAAFRAGQLDFGYAVGESALDIENLRKTNGNIKATVAKPVSSGVSMSFNLTLPKYQDERVRRAISLAMDREQIIQVVLDGYGVSYAIMPWIFVFDQEPKAADFGKWRRTDRQEARALLAAAGQSNLEITMVFYNYRDAQYARQDEVLVDQMREAGIKLEAKRLDYTSFNSQWVGVTFDDAADGWATAGSDADTYFYQQVHSTSPGNRNRIKDPQIDQWADQQRTELNPAARREIHRKMWDRLLDQVYRVEKPAPVSFVAYQPWLRSFRSVGALGANTYYYDFGPQVKDIWLDK